MERLIRAIINERFRWENYLNGGTWNGIKVQNTGFILQLWANRLYSVYQ